MNNIMMAHLKERSDIGSLKDTSQVSIQLNSSCQASPEDEIIHVRVFHKWMQV